MGKILKSNVDIKGVSYKAGTAAADIPDEHRSELRNPKVWEYTDGETPAEKPATPASIGGATLAARVDVDGRWYGPGDNVPADVAAKIRNPKAWKDGKVPDLAAKDAGDTGKTGDATQSTPAADHDAEATTAEADSDDKPATRRRRTAS